jgi:hypothetical protein
VLILGTVILGPAVDFGDRVLLVAIGLLLSMATHGLVENPCRYSTRWQMPRRAAVWALALTSLSVVATLLITSALPPDRGTGTAAAVAFAPATASFPAAGAHGSVPGAHPGPTGRLASGNPTVTASPTTAGARSTAPASARATATTAAAPPAPLVAEGRQAAQFISTALSQNQVPANLTPPLDEPDLDEASPFFNGCLLSWTVTVQPDCVSARQDAKKSMVLFGDSHAAQW